MLAQLYDVAARDLDSYGLKDVARHFGVVGSRSDLSPARGHPARLPRRAGPAHGLRPRRRAGDARRCPASCRRPTSFRRRPCPSTTSRWCSAVTRPRSTPSSCASICIAARRCRARAPGARWPAASPRCTARAWRENVLHVDVTSLYPSLMLTQGLMPAVGSARDLRRRCCATSANSGSRPSGSRARRSAEADRLLLGALQQTFKILINSFYGYLGTGFGHWNDFEAANRITAEGRRLVLGLVDRLEDLGATVIEVDTDGLYFVPPASLAGREAEDAAARAAGRGVPRRAPARARRALPRHVQLQDEELRAPRFRRQAPRQGLRASLARHRALPAAVDGGDVPSAPHRPARRRSPPWCGAGRRTSPRGACRCVSS